jgi:hypothetical protein
MNYRYYLTILSSRVEVFPLNFLKTSLVDKKGSGEIFYRRTFNGTLRFYCNTKTGTTDFELLYLIEQVDNCTDLIFEIEQKDSAANTYHNYWTGHFSTTDGTWDLDKSTFDVTPLPYDDYLSLDLYGEKEYNIFLAGGPAHNITTNTILPAEVYDDNFWLIDVIEYLVEEVFGATVTVTSTFLNNATNPVTLDINKWRYLMLAQKSDIKRPHASNPATVGNLSFKSLMDMLRMFNLFWAFDGTTVRIEHYDYWQGIAGLDLRTQAIASKQNKYSYVKGAMPMYEKFSFMEASDTNYTEHIISYDPNCTDKGTTNELAFNITTDLDYIYNCVTTGGGVAEGSISDDGWVILANFVSGGNYYVYNGTAYNNATASNNYVCSWSYLLRTLFMHGRVLIAGEIEGSPISFISTVKTKKQDIKAIVCHEDNYVPEDYITTELGETYFLGQKGYVDQATLHPDGHVEFALLYGEDTNETPTVVSKYKVINCVVVLPRHITTILSEPNTVDTYYSILFDDGTVDEECYEVLVPAGTVYQDEDTVGDHAAVSGLYTQDSSIDDWMFYYNGSATWTEVADCGSPPAPPGAPPVAPTCFGATQLDQWECVNVGWSNPPITTYYEVWRNIDGGVYELIATVPSTWSDYDDCESQDHAHRNETWCYKIKACNVAGCSAFSNEVCIDINTA